MGLHKKIEPLLFKNRIDNLFVSVNSFYNFCQFFLHEQIDFGGFVEVNVFIIIKLQIVA